MGGPASTVIVASTAAEALLFFFLLFFSFLFLSFESFISLGTDGKRDMTGRNSLLPLSGEHKVIVAPVKRARDDFAFLKSLGSLLVKAREDWDFWNCLRGEDEDTLRGDRRGLILRRLPSSITGETGVSGNTGASPRDLRGILGELSCDVGDEVGVLSSS